MDLALLAAFCSRPVDLHDTNGEAARAVAMARAIVAKCDETKDEDSAEGDDGIKRLRASHEQLTAAYDRLESEYQRAQGRIAELQAALAAAKPPLEIPPGQRDESEPAVTLDEEGHPVKT